MGFTDATVKAKGPVGLDDIEKGTKHAFWTIWSTGLEPDLDFVSGKRWQYALSGQLYFDCSTD